MFISIVGSVNVSRMGSIQAIRNYFLLAVISTHILHHIIQAESTEQFKEVMGPLTEECRKEGAYSFEDVDSVLHRNMAETRSAMCLLRCVYQRLGGMQGEKLSSAQQVLSSYKKVYGDDKAMMVDAEHKLARCRQHVVETPGDGCDVAHELLLCLKQFD